MPNKRWEEIASSRRRSANHNRSERFFCKVTVGDVMHQTDDTDNVFVCVEVWRKCARLPHIPPFSGMLRNQHIGDLYNFPGKRAFQYVFDPACPKPREYFHSNLAQDFLGLLSGQALHERIEHPVTQFRVIDDDAFRCTVNDFFVELCGFAQSVVAEFLCSDIARESEDAFGSAFAVQDRTDHHIPPSRSSRDSSGKEACEAANFAVPGGIDRRLR